MGGCSPARESASVDYVAGGAENLMRGAIVSPGIARPRVREPVQPLEYAKRLYGGQLVVAMRGPGLVLCDATNLWSSLGDLRVAPTRCASESSSPSDLETGKFARIGPSGSRLRAEHARLFVKRVRVAWKGFGSLQGLVLSL